MAKFVYVDDDVIVWSLSYGFFWLASKWRSVIRSHPIFRHLKQLSTMINIYQLSTGLGIKLTV